MVDHFPGWAAACESGTRVDSEADIVFSREVLKTLTFQDVFLQVQTNKEYSWALIMMKAEGEEVRGIALSERCQALIEGDCLIGFFVQL